MTITSIKLYESSKTIINKYKDIWKNIEDNEKLYVH